MVIWVWCRLLSGRNVSIKISILLLVGRCGLWLFIILGPTLLLIRWNDWLCIMLINGAALHWNEWLCVILMAWDLKNAHLELAGH